MVLARRKTFEFRAWSPDNETLKSFRKRTIAEFEEFLDELIEAAQDEGDDIDTQPLPPREDY